MTPEERARAVFTAARRDEDYKITPTIDEVAEAIRAAVAEEREACAKVADAYNPTQDAAYFAQEIAQAIRSRA